MIEELIWPQVATCHAVDFQSRRFYPDGNVPYEPPTKVRRWGYGYTPFRTCGYCGSIHPEDMIALLRAGGASLGGADWKYGWPHKFYLTYPDPIAGQEIQVGSSSEMVNGKRVETSIMGVANVLHAKFYNEHLGDEGYSPDALSLLIRAISVHTDIEFALEGGRLKYSAPYRGYQKA